MNFRALTVYEYYDGPTLFTAQKDGNPHQIYLFRWTASGDEDEDVLDRRVYKADGFDIEVKEDHVDFSEVGYEH